MEEQAFLWKYQRWQVALTVMSPLEVHGETEWEHSIQYEPYHSTASANKFGVSNTTTQITLKKVATLKFLLLHF